MSDDQNQDKSQKTEEPTLRRLEKAREDGQIPFSKEVGHGFMLLALFLVVWLLLPRSLKGISTTLRPFLGAFESLPIEGKGLVSLVKQLLIDVGLSLGLPALFLVTAALSGGFSQTRFLVSLKALKPKLSKFSLIKGFNRLFGASAWVEFFKNMLKFMAIVLMGVILVRPEFFKLAPLLSLEATEVLSYLGSLFLKFLGLAVSFVILVALLDYGYQKHQFLQNLKMSHQEIKDENKETEGDPHVRQRLRQIRQERSRRRIAQAVSEASVVVMNPTHFAVALKYKHGEMEAPQVVAKGRDYLALQIKKIALEHDIPIVEDPPLARALDAGVEEGQEIPVQYYEAVAKIMRYVLKINRQKR